MSGVMGRLGLAQAGTSRGRKRPNVKGTCDLVATKGDDPFAATLKTIEGLGGMQRFVARGGTVVIKPNIGWDRAPEYAANTNPEVVAALVSLCFEAGAKRVNVFDIPCNSPQRTYENSGIKKAAERMGARVYFVDDWNTLKAQFDFDSPMSGWPIFKDAIECDTFINVPILKHHGLTGLTLSMKNLMGVCGGNRGQIHSDIGRKLVDLTYFINPDLTVIDAYRVLLNNGPTGGSLNDVKLIKTVIAGTDPTLVDTYACSLVGTDPRSIPYLAEAMDRKFGKSDISKASILELNA